jgi:prepilin-type N-terminal cleavage/methylation domain-containing protein
MIYDLRFAICRKSSESVSVNRQSPIVNDKFPGAFTLIELLAVITILGIIAGLAVPALKELGKSNGNIGASQQLLADLGHARQLAIANHTTVYMAFVPTNFWGNFTTAEKDMVATTNLIDKQLTGYTFISDGAVGDQPGRHQWNYLEPWKSLPAGTFIAAQKFAELPGQFYTITTFVSGALFGIYGFSTNAIPFPTATNSLEILPCVAFNYLGQLTVDGVNLAQSHEYIPLARGSVSFGVDPSSKTPVLTPVKPGDVTESPPGNSTGSSYNIIDIDPLTGRATLQFQKVQ